MATEHPFTLAQLAQILSALDGERRNPNTRRNAIKAIEHAASRFGLDSDNVFAAAADLLSGRVGATEWRASLGGGKPADGAHEAARITAEPPAEPVAEDGGKRTGIERRPTAEFAPVSTRMPPGNSFDSTVLPESRERAGATFSRRAGLSSISGSIRCCEKRLASSTEGCTASIGPGAWWMT